VIARSLKACALAVALSAAAGATSFAQAPAGTSTGPAAGVGDSAQPAVTPGDALKKDPPGQMALSNESTTTRWAYAIARGTAFSTPSKRSHRVGRLRYLTEDGFPEVYIVLSSWKDANHTQWLHVRLPQRPNNVTGWVVRSAVGDFHIVHTELVVDKRKLRATLYRNGRRIFSAPVGVGKASTPTPAGRSWIREKFPVSGNPVYGPRALGTATYSNTLTDWPGGGVVGMHGTDQPYLVPGHPSHGCIRLHNADILRLYPLVPVGTPLLILG
jgi:lipoprotein-anchoring transpeptidase ErfK/SrfK